jgi:predicted enzyme related to lactoylglutathione lyase
MKVQAIDATFYTVKDLDTCTKFYAQVLGFEPTLAVPQLVSEWTFPGGESFGIYKSPEGRVSGSGVMFQVDDVAAAVETCKSFGVKFDDDGHIEETPGCHMAFANDPEGNHFMLHKRK